jgi:N-acyl-phosphatidylethanolamine-hydrolysing phospholipase D
MKKKSFINPHLKQMRRSFKDFLLWKIGYYDDELKEEVAIQDPFKQFSKPHLQKPLPQATWINHSTCLICTEGGNFLTDPILSDRCSPLPFFGPKRRHPPGMTYSELPKIDFVLISHDHYDHLDKKTVLTLSRMFSHLAWFVPKGVKRWFDRLEISPVYEFGWWEERELTLPSCPDMRGKITAVPAQHFSGRRGYDLNSTLWLGWVVEICSSTKENPVVKRCYFAGDTGYNAFDFKKIGELFAPIDLSLIPIGSYLPKAFMEPVHICPRDAVRIHLEVGSSLSVGIHWKTFRLSDEPMERPPYDLYQALIKENINPSEFIVVELGHAFNW